MNNPHCDIVRLCGHGFSLHSIRLGVLDVILILKNVEVAVGPE